MVGWLGTQQGGKKQMGSLTHVLLEVLLLAAAATGTTTISNLKPRLSTTGEIVNAHDGTVRWLDGAYWMHAAQCKLPLIHPRARWCDKVPLGAGTRFQQPVG